MVAEAWSMQLIDVLADEETDLNPEPKTDLTFKTCPQLMDIMTEEETEISIQNQKQTLPSWPVHS